MKEEIKYRMTVAVIAAVERMYRIKIHPKKAEILAIQLCELLGLPVSVATYQMYFEHQDDLIEGLKMFRKTSIVFNN